MEEYKAGTNRPHARYPRKSTGTAMNDMTDTNLSPARTGVPGSDPHAPDEPCEGMAWIPGGTFMMGSDHHYPEEEPAHRVRVDGFWMDRTTVTNRDFARFVAATGYVTLAEKPANALVSQDYGPRGNEFSRTVRGIGIAIADAAEHADHMVSPEEAIRVAISRQ
jgi:formylglycine-generating enzyme required for sulfatase activity